MRGTPAAATASADHSGDNGITPEARLGGGPGMGAAIVRRHDLDILAPRPDIAVLVLDPGVWKVHMPVVVRQLVLPRPPRDLFGLAIRPTVAVFLPRLRSWRNR